MFNEEHNLESLSETPKLTLGTKRYIEQIIQSHWLRQKVDFTSQAQSDCIWFVRKLSFSAFLFLWHLAVFFTNH